MTIWWLILILSSIGAVGTGFIWIIVHISKMSSGGGKTNNLNDSIEAAAREDVEHVFNDDFREELRNRGRLNFENIINENAMFLQQDLRLTISQINDYMKTEITTKLQGEFEKYEQSINDAKQLAVESLQKTNQAIDEERKKLSEQVEKDIDASKALLIERFESNMTDIINHYLLAAIGNQIDLNDQLDLIISDLETNKVAMVEDLKNGA
jgi:vacuolar-type H+-ATPase subunit H